MKLFYHPTFICVLTLLFISTSTFSQILNPRVPVSFTTGMHVFDDGLENHVVPALDMSAVAREDEARINAGLPPFDGRRIPVGWNIEKNGQWFTLDNGDLLWKMKISSPGAIALEVFFDEFYLPEGTELSVYSMDKSDYQGPHTAYNNPKSGYYATDLIDGDEIILEYYQPADITESAKISVQDIGHQYIDLSARFDRSDDCQVDINCPEGDNWQDEKQGVVKLRVSVAQTSGPAALYWCSGVLMNNTAMDCKPYILSAFHCIDGGGGSSTIPQSDFDQLRFYFNNERAVCGEGFGPNWQIQIGCEVAARSQSGGGNGSDFVLLEMANDIPDSYNAYWNGWNLQSSTIAGGGVGIHHPSGDSKKISTSTNNFITSSWNGGVQGYWRVIWTGTESGHGVTEGGSSGSPLFDNNKLVVGTLTGGSSYCNSVQPGGQNQPDWYGKMYYHWDQNSGSQVVHLKTKLDPLNTGQSAMLGTYAPCSATSVEEEGFDFADVISVFPNPTSGEFQIDLEDRYNEVETIRVYSILGKQVTQLSVISSRMAVDLSDQPRGLYLISFERRNGPEVTQKIALR